jgi:diadenosine tetraphosphatase ApaH/serine/threonine PP2A family protein phosphatase
MRCAIISDVHANPDALRAVLGSPAVHAADALVCLGDSVGYYTQPNECIELIRERTALCIAGNHDLAALGRLETTNFSRTARRAIEWTKPRLSSETRRYLAALPLFANFERHFACVHAALHPEPNAILHLSSPIRLQLSFEKLASGTIGASICFFGHTHRAIAYGYDGARPFSLHGDRVELPKNGFYLVNPGSVGQPRDGDERAAFATYDTDERVIEFHRVAYDVARPIERAYEAGLLATPNLRERASDWMQTRRDGARKAAGCAVHRLRARLERP